MVFLDTILEFLFPAKCAICRKSGSDLCLECLKDVPEAERESAEWIFPLYDYRHPGIKKALWLLKYKGKRRLGRIFAEAMYGRLLEELSELSVMENFRDPILIPIPLSSKRYRERGYNQAELIAQALVKLDTTTHLRHGVDVSNAKLRLEGNVLVKSTETKHQAHIENRTERLRNIVGSFSVKNEEVIKNKNIILIDDITTTGATLLEARKVLRSAGARKVIAITIAH